MPLYYHIIPIDKYLWLVWPPNNICLPTSSGYNDFTSRRHHNDGNWIGGIVPQTAKLLRLVNDCNLSIWLVCIREKTGEWYTMTRVGLGLGAQQGVNIMFIAWSRQPVVVCTMDLPLNNELLVIWNHCQVDLCTGMSDIFYHILTYYMNYVCVHTIYKYNIIYIIIYI